MQILNINLVPNNTIPVFHSSQYDAGRTATVVLYNGRVPYNIEEGDEISIEERKGDNTIAVIKVNAVAGTNTCEIVITNNGTRIGSGNFIHEVEKSPTEGGIESESEINNLAEQIENIATTKEYPELNTQDKSIIGAINELNAGGGVTKEYVDNQDNEIRNFVEEVAEEVENINDTLGQLDQIVKDVMCGGTGAEWTEAEKKNAQDRIGIVVITQEEYDLIEVKGENTIYIIT